MGLPLPPLAADTITSLRAQLPAAATVANPLDYTAMIWGEVETLRDLIRTVGEDPAIGHVLVFYDRPPGISGASLESWVAVEEGILAGASVSPVPVMVAATLPELLDDEAAWQFCEAGVPAVAGLRTGIAVAAALAAPLPDAARLRAIAAHTVAGGDGPWLAEHEAKALLRARGVPVPERPTRHRRGRRRLRLARPRAAQWRSRSPRPTCATRPPTAPSPSICTTKSPSAKPSAA